MFALDTSSLQVFLCSSLANFPFWFARHMWFVINDNGTLTRYEVLFRKRQNNHGNQHLVINAFHPFQGIEVIPFCNLLHWGSRTHGVVEGPLAETTAHVIRKSLHLYPHRNNYALHGPNSNTYVQWVLDQVPEWNITLPPSAYGRFYNPERSR